MLPYLFLCALCIGNCNLFSWFNLGHILTPDFKNFDYNPSFTICLYCRINVNSRVLNAAAQQVSCKWLYNQSFNKKNKNVEHFLQKIYL